jgi:hypothetical protein
MLLGWLELLPWLCEPWFMSVLDPVAPVLPALESVLPEVGLWLPWLLWSELGYAEVLPVELEPGCCWSVEV